MQNYLGLAVRRFKFFEIEFLGSSALLNYGPEGRPGHRKFNFLGNFLGSQRGF